MSIKDMTNTSFWRLFRFLFVLFSLFLMGDAFYRWDGVSFYASFYEFIPALALVFIQWSIISLICTAVISLTVMLPYSVSSLLGLRVKFDYLLMSLGVFVFLGLAFWVGKKIAFPFLQTNNLIKIFTLVSALVISFALTAIFSVRLNRFTQSAQERITPLVWLFGTIFFLSVPIVSYHILFKGSDKTLLEPATARSESDTERPNIILVTYDALATRDMSVYGYHRETTPFITEWSKSASLFTNVKAESTFTTPTTASLMTGKRLWSHLTWYQASSIPKNKSENIAREMKINGYYTMAFVQNSNASPEMLGIADDFSKTILMPGERGFFLHHFHTALTNLFHGKILLYDWILLDDFYPTFLFQKYIYNPFFMPIYTRLFSGKRYAFSSGNTPLDKFISDYDKAPPPEPFFAWIHLFPPHSVYIPPESFQGTFDPSQSMREDSEQVEALNRIKKLYREGLTEEELAISDVQTIETLRARYNEHILFCDKEFEDFIGNLETRNLLDNSVLILSSDHGEIFEHNALMHEETPYEPVINIPLIIKEPNQREGNIFHDVIEQIDISATILDVSGIPMPSWLEGRSLMPLIRGRHFQTGPAFTMHLQRSRNHKITHGFVSVYEGSYKLVYFIDENRSLLFNLNEDPDEKNDLFNKEHETAQRLLDMIKDNIMKANKKMGGE